MCACEDTKSSHMLQKVEEEPSVKCKEQKQHDKAKLWEIEHVVNGITRDHSWNWKVKPVSSAD